MPDSDMALAKISQQQRVYRTLCLALSERIDQMDWRDFSHESFDCAPFDCAQGRQDRPFDYVPFDFAQGRQGRPERLHGRGRE